MNWINCCHVAIALAVANIIQLLCFFSYNLKLNERTIKLEKKNGSEQKQINELKKEVQTLKEKNA